MYSLLLLLLLLPSYAQDAPGQPAEPEPPAQESTDDGTDEQVSDTPAPSNPQDEDSTTTGDDAEEEPPTEPPNPSTSPGDETTTGDGATGTEASQDPSQADTLEIIEGPTIIKYVEAPYPQAALEAGIEGTVTLLIELDEEGEVLGVEVPEPVGNGFDEAAVDAVLSMTFAPAQTEAGPVPVIFEFAYTFVLQADEEDIAQAELAPVNFAGLVRQMGTRKPLEGITVTIIFDPSDDTYANLDALSTQTGADGSFELRGLPSGKHTVRLLHLDHVTAETQIEIVEHEITSATFWMRATLYRENELVGVYHKVKEDITRRTIRIDEVKRIPGTFGDPIKVIQTLPGAARSPFGTGLLVIRGSNPEDSGVYVDGIRIPIIYHLTGTTSVLSPDIVESVDYLPGMYGVEYGRSMGGVVDVRTRSEFSEQGKFNWGTDILDSQFYYEGRVGKEKESGLAIGARRSYIDLFIPIFTKGTNFSIKPRYWDYQVKYIPQLHNRQKLEVFVYGFDDILQISTPDDFAQGSDQDTQGDLKVEYLSHRFLIRYEKGFSEDLRLSLTPSLGYDFAYFGLGSEFTTESFTGIAQLRGNLVWSPSRYLEVVPGIDFIGIYGGFDFASALSFADINDPLAEREAISFNGGGTGLSPDSFFKLNIRPLGDDRWLLTPGVRFSHVNVTQHSSLFESGEPSKQNGFGLDPRLLTRLQVFDGGMIKAGTGLYTQPPQPQETASITEGVATPRFERSWASSIGFEHQVSQSVEWDIDLFYKALDNLIVFNEAWTGGDQPIFVNDGAGRAYGLELIARHNPIGRFFGWVSYTLSKSERRDAPEDAWYPFDFDQTHIFSAQGGYDLPFDFGLSAQIQYTTGTPTTPFNAGIYDVDGDFYNGFRIGGYNDERQPPYFQTSFRVDKLWTYKRWQLQTYVDLLNAIRGVNAEFTTYAYDYSEYAYVRGLPFIPNLGLEAKFWL
jgi:TonB family protein